MPASVDAGGKIGLHGVYMRPQNSNASDYSDAGWGGGIHVMYPLPVVQQLFAGSFVAEAVNLLSDDIEYFTELGLRVNQSTSQNIVRVMVGGQFGGHGRGFIRPHAGLNVGVMYYSISSKLTIPDDFDPDRSIMQDLGGEDAARFAYDVTLGLDLNFEDAIAVDGGVRYVKSFGVPQPFDTEGSIELHPDYFQIYLGVGVGFDFLARQ